MWVCERCEVLCVGGSVCGSVCGGFVWVCGSLSEFVDRCLNLWTDVWISVWVYGSVCGFLDRCVDHCVFFFGSVCGFVDRCVCLWTAVCGSVCGLLGQCGFIDRCVSVRGFLNWCEGRCVGLGIGVWIVV